MFTGIVAPGLLGWDVPSPSPGLYPDPWVWALKFSSETLKSSGSKSGKTRLGSPKLGISMLGSSALGSCCGSPWGLPSGSTWGSGLGLGIWALGRVLG